VRFDGVDDYLAGDNTDATDNIGPFDTAELSVFVLVSPRWATHPGGNLSPFSIRTFTGTTRISLHMDGNKANMHSWNDASQAFAPFTFVQNQFFLLEFIWTGDQEAHYVNGTYVDTDTHALNLTDNEQPVRIGTAEPDFENWLGDIAEVFVYDRPLSGPERLSIESYIEGKWGVDTSP
jgi:hypothetical protein